MEMVRRASQSLCSFRLFPTPNPQQPTAGSRPRGRALADRIPRATLLRICTIVLTCSGPAGVVSKVIGDHRRDCTGGSWWPSFWVGKPEEVRPDVSESHFWGRAQTHGVNGIAAQKVSSRWEQNAAVQGTLSEDKFSDSVHAVQPAQQGADAATDKDVAEFWETADDKSKTSRKSYRVPERGCFGNVAVAK